MTSMPSHPNDILRKFAGSKHAGGVFFDIETLGLHARGPVVSAGFLTGADIQRYASGLDPSANIQDLFEQIVSEKEVPTVPDVYNRGRVMPGQKGYVRAGKKVIGSGEALENVLSQHLKFSKPEQALEELNRIWGSGTPSQAELAGFFKTAPTQAPREVTEVFEQALKAAATEGETVWVHNLQFESRMMAPRWGNRLFGSGGVGEQLVHTMGFTASAEGHELSERVYRTGLGVTAKRAELAEVVAYNPRKAGHAGEQLYDALVAHHVKDKTKGVAKIGDTMDIARAVYAMAQGKGYMKDYGLHAGMAVEDWMQAMGITGGERHAGSADDFVQGLMKSHLFDLGERLRTGAINDFDKTFLGNIEKIMGDTARYEQRLLNNLTDQAALFMREGGIRQVKGKEVAGRYIPKVEVLKLDSIVTGAGPARTRQGPAWTKITRTFTQTDWSEYMKYRWASMSPEMQRAIGQDKWDAIAGRFSSAMRGTVPGDESVAALRETLGRKIGLTERGIDFAEDLFKSHTDDLAALTKMTRGKAVAYGLAGAAVGIGLGMFMESPASTQAQAMEAEATGRPNRNIASSAWGIGAAGAGTYFAAKSMNINSFKMPSNLGWAHSGLIAGAGALAYASLAGLNNAANAPGTPDMPAAAAIGTVGGLMALGSSISSENVKKSAQYVEKAFHGVKGRAAGEAAEAGINALKHVGGPMLLAGGLLVGAGLVSLMSTSAARSDGMTEGGYGQANRSAMTDFGSPFNWGTLGRSLQRMGTKAAPNFAQISKKVLNAVKSSTPKLVDRVGGSAAVASAGAWKGFQSVKSVVNQAFHANKVPLAGYAQNQFNTVAKKMSTTTPVRTVSQGISRIHPAQTTAKGVTAEMPQSYMPMQQRVVMPGQNIRVPEVKTSGAYRPWKVSSTVGTPAFPFPQRVRGHARKGNFRTGGRYERRPARV